MAAVRDSEFNDTGLIPFSGVTVSGVVFDDAAEDGLLDEDDERLEAMEVWVERTILSADEAMDAGWLSRIDDGVAGCDLDAAGEPLEASERYYDPLPTGVAKQLARDHDARDFDMRDKDEDSEQPGKPGTSDPEQPDEPEGPAVPEPDEPEVPGTDGTDGSSEPEGPDADGAGDSGESGVPGAEESEVPGSGAPGDAEVPAPAPDQSEGESPVVFALRRAVALIMGQTQAEVAEGAVADGTADASRPEADAPEGVEPEESEGLEDPEVSEPGNEGPHKVYADPDAVLKAQLPAPDRLEDDGILHVGEWERVASTETDEEGAYDFSGLPVADAYGRPYSYRVRMVKPADARYVPLKAGDDRNADNDYGHMNVLGALTDEEQGTTEKLDVVTVRPNGVNAYGHAYAVLGGHSWSRGAGTAIDLGIHIPVDDKQDFTTQVYEDDWATKIMRLVLPQTGDPFSFMRFFLVVLAGVSVIVLIVSRVRRRREESEAPALM